MRVALLAVLLSGCALCHVPARPPDLPRDVEVTAFLDQQRECWTLEIRPGAELVLQLLVDVLRMTVGTMGG